MTKKIDPSKINVEQQIVMGIIELIRHKIFYGHILQQLTKIYFDDKSNGIETMGVGKNPDEMFIKLYICKNFVKKLWEDVDGDDENGWQHLLGILEHETLHIVFQHLSLTFSDKLRGNVAVDLVVNSCINKSNLPQSALFPETYGFEANKSAYWYYNNLKDNKKFQDQIRQGVFGNCSDSGSLGDFFGSHKLWSDIKNDPLLNEMCKDIIRKAKDLCNREYGNIPGTIVSQIDNLLNKKKSVIPWNKALRMFVANSTESNLDYTMKRISKRFGIRPGTKKEDVLELAVGIDTSGSINDELLNIFFNEIYWIWKNDVNITIYEADTKIQNKYKYKGKFTGKIHGRGGTNLEPILKETEKKYDALVYFTDFYAPRINKKYNIPILWILKTELNKSEFPYKWGKHIKIENNSAVSS